MLLIGVVLIGIMAVAAELLAQAGAAGSDLGFLQHGTRGISMMTRAALMFVAALAVGAIVGRLLPALLMGVARGRSLDCPWRPAAVWGRAGRARGAETNGGNRLTTGRAYRAPDGRPIGEDEANAIGQAVFEKYSPELSPDSLLPYSVSYGIARSRYSEVLARESAALVGATVLTGGIGAIVVQRRRRE